MGEKSIGILGVVLTQIFYVNNIVKQNPSTLFKRNYCRCSFYGVFLVTLRMCWFPKIISICSYKSHHGMRKSTHSSVTSFSWVRLLFFVLFLSFILFVLSLFRSLSLSMWFVWNFLLLLFLLFFPPIFFHFTSKIYWQNILLPTRQLVVNINSALIHNPNTMASSSLFDLDMASNKPHSIQFNSFQLALFSIHSSQSISWHLYHHFFFFSLHTLPLFSFSVPICLFLAIVPIVSLSSQHNYVAQLKHHLTTWYLK